MKLILHHFWKDVRLLRWTLLLWFSILAFETGFSFLSTQPGFDLTSKVSQSAVPVLFLLLLGLTWTLLIVRLVQSEPVLGTTSFWLTRPIPPLVAAASKLLFILLLAILPSVAMHGLELWAYRVHPEVARGVLYPLLVVDGLLTLAVVWLATYTRNVPQFWAVISGLALLFVVFASFYAQRRLLLQANVVPLNLQASRFEVAGFLLVGGLLLSLIIQYGFRRTRTAFATGIACVGLSWLAAAAWPFPLSWRWKIPPSEHRAVVHIGYQFNPQVPVSWQSNFMGSSNKSFNLSIVPPVMPQSMPSPDFIEGSFQPPGGERVELEPAATAGPIQFPPQNWASLLQKARPGLTVVPASNWAREQTAVLQFAPGKSDQLNGKAGSLDLRIHGTFWTLAPRAELPLRSTRFARIPNFVVRVTSATKSTDGLVLDVSAVGYAKLNSAPLVYLLVDEKNHLGIVASDMGNSSTLNSALTGSDWNLLYAYTTLGFEPGTLPASVQTTVQNNQVDDWTLVIYEICPAGSFESDLTVPSVKL